MKNEKSKKSLDIHPLKEKEIPAVAKIFKDYVCFHSSIDPFFRGCKNLEKHLEKTLLDYVLLPKRKAFTAEAEGLVVGFVTAQILKLPDIFKTEEFGAICDLAVIEEYRRRGMGSRLAREAINWLKKESMKRIELNVLAKNRKACQFWKKLGFEISAAHSMYLKD